MPLPYPGLPPTRIRQNRPTAFGFDPSKSIGNPAASFFGGLVGGVTGYLGGQLKRKQMMEDAQQQMRLKLMYERMKPQRPMTPYQSAMLDLNKQKEKRYSEKDKRAAAREKYEATIKYAEDLLKGVYGPIGKDLETELAPFVAQANESLGQAALQAFVSGEGEYDPSVLMETLRGQFPTLQKLAERRRAEKFSERQRLAQTRANARGADLEGRLQEALGKGVIGVDINTTKKAQTMGLTDFTDNPIKMELYELGGPVITEYRTGRLQGRQMNPAALRQALLQVIGPQKAAMPQYQTEIENLIRGLETVGTVNPAQ